MLSNDLLIDAFNRVKEIVHGALESLNEEQLILRPTKDANSVAWLIWHLTRIQDDHMADIMNEKQVWHSTWSDKFNLKLDKDDTGYAHSSDQVALVKASQSQLQGYYDDVHAKTVAYIKELSEKDYERVVDTNWNPPVTLAVRLVSVISDNLQHAGQAAYVRGLILNP